MIHAGGHQGARGRSSALSRNYPNIFGHPDWRAPLRCGFLFCTFSCILFVIGVILTWLGIHDIFGESVPITGPILLSVGTLMLLLAARQFYLAHSRKRIQKAQEPVPTAIVDNDDGSGAATVVMDKDNTYDEIIPDQDGNNSKAPLMDIKLPSSPPLESGTYVWPPIPHQSPYTSMAMMLYKDPAMMYGPFLAKQGRSGYLPASLPSTSGACSSTSEPIPTVASSSSMVGLSHAIPSPSETGAAALSEFNEASTSQAQDRVRQASPDPSSLSCQAADPASEKPKSPSKVTFADKVSSDGLPAMVATAGISNLPNRTAFMMLTTLELQETI